MSIDVRIVSLGADGPTSLYEYEGHDWSKAKDKTWAVSLPQRVLVTFVAKAREDDCFFLAGAALAPELVPRLAGPVDAVLLASPAPWKQIVSYWQFWSGLCPSCLVLIR